MLIRSAGEIKKFNGCRICEITELYLCNNMGEPLRKISNRSIGHLVINAVADELDEGKTLVDLDKLCKGFEGFEGFEVFGGLEHGETSV